jgi:DNA-binding XRE family transcriptional regulator
MEWELRVAAQRELDHKLKPYLTARRVHRPLGGWLRTVRKVLGLSAAEMARDLQVCPSAVFQMERAELAMSCRLVYAIVPFQSNFEGQGIVWAKQKLWRRKAAPRRKKKAGRIKTAAVE